MRHLAYVNKRTSIVDAILGYGDGVQVAEPEEHALHEVDPEAVQDGFVYDAATDTFNAPAPAPDAEAPESV